MNDLFVISKSKFFDELVLDADNRAEVIHIQHALEKAVVGVVEDEEEEEHA